MSQRDRILAALKRGELSTSTLVLRVGGSDSGVQRILADLHTAGTIKCVRGSGRGSDPRVWAINREPRA